ncbi:M3 family metallopeptidase [Pseudomonas sp. Ant30-3]|uniref:M3 family metallopeptidase n=1 Tax=Pseudomonas sp. Ant30-3 TaxID=1488328 RepID=UPI00048AFF11|nr:M3 family metallopeptidase [Pseudomonas sp. Ant30-3]
MTLTNPLLQKWTLPPWTSIRAEHLVPAIEAIIADNRQALADIIASQSIFPTWDDLVIAVDETDARLAETMAVIDTLDGVNVDDEAWQTASNWSRNAAMRYTSEKMNNRALFETYQRLANSPIALNFDEPRQAVLRKILRKFQMSGIDLNNEQQQVLARTNDAIGAFEGLFIAKLDIATQAWDKRFDDEAPLNGLSLAMKASLALNAQQAGHAGWLMRLDQNTYQHVMTHAEDRALREEYFIAYTTRASDQGPHAGQYDNGPALESLMDLRQRKARLLGYANFAQLGLATKMAASEAHVSAFLRQQIALVTADLESDVQALKAFAIEHEIADIQPWDRAFLAEKLRRHTHDGALKNLKSYFPLDGTLRRLCLFGERMFGIKIVEQKAFNQWHENVRLFEISEHDRVVGYIYLDPFHRVGSTDYAWTATLRNRHRDAEGQVALPIAVLYGNFTEGVADMPCLLVHQDLRVLFHEFGHCLQHVLTRTPHFTLSGISEFARDGAEFTGQMFELWCQSKEFLLWIAAEYQTGARLGDQRVERALVATQAQTSWQTAELLMSALFDFELHRCHGDGRSVQQVFDDIQKEIPHLQLPSYCRFANSFDYMVTGYEASVYAYKWSGVLATEAFKRFQRDGVFHVATGKAFREAVFTPGDARSLLTSLEVFLERPIDQDVFPRLD